MRSNLVSVIMPAYNCKDLVGISIESVINQSYENWELIIVDDCSTDYTFDVLEKYSNLDNRIKIYRQPVNMGVSNARNKAIEESKGRFIAFLDSDDIWKKTKLENQLKFMIENDYAFTFTSYEIIEESGEKINKIFRAPFSIDYKGYLKNTIIGCLTVIIDREKISNIKMPEGPLEDVLTWMSILKDNQVAYGLNQNLALYRITKGSISRNKIQNAKRYFIVLRERQNLSLIYSLYCHFNYTFNAVYKRLF